ncbi:hypothetical protein FACS1894192_10160 [Bacilli bacterium]|nr:hypothetical protein FACS1894192_10160 [Bacilli bacterium]
MSPNITVMLEFSKPRADYVTYTNRDEAVELDNKRIQKELKEEFEFKNENYVGYLNYTDRAAATLKSKNATVTPLFTQTDYHATTDELNEIKGKLQQAQINKNVMWKMVVSFDNDFLEKNGILNKETGELNQYILKDAIQKTMPTVMKREGLSDDAFWWGNIHLNTDNIHIHLGISEINSTRPFKEFENYKERKGMFSQITLRTVKSKVVNFLKNPEVNAQRIVKEQVIASVKKEMLGDIVGSSNLAQYQQLFYLQQAYKNLPQNGKLSFKSNAKEFQTAKSFLNQYIDNFLENDGRELHEKFLKSSKDFLEEFRDDYTENYDLEKFLVQRENVFREELGNKVLKYLKNTPPGTSDKLSFMDLKDMSSSELSGIVESLSKTTISERKLEQNFELGIAKYMFRQATLKEKSRVRIAEFLKLDKVVPVESDLEFVELKKDDIRTELQLLELRRRPKRKLTTTDVKTRNQLADEIIDVEQIPMEKIKDKHIKKLQDELFLAENITDESLFEIFKKTKPEYLTALTTDIQILQIKQKIATNNIAIQKENQTELRGENAKLFRELKSLREVKHTGTLNSEKPISALSINSNYPDKQNYDEEPDIKAYPEFSPSSIFVSHSGTQFVNGLSKLLNNTNSAERRAMMLKARSNSKKRRHDDDEEERNR